MKRLGAVGVAACMAAMVIGSQHARAQAVGAYVGTTADGNGITLTVASNGSGGFIVSGLSYSLTGTCHPGGSTFNTGWGVGPNAPINSYGKSKFKVIFGYLYTTVSLAFNGSTVTGDISSITPTFAPYTTKPKRSVLCTSPTQTLTAAIGGAALLPQGKPVASLLASK